MKKNKILIKDRLNNKRKISIILIVIGRVSGLASIIN